MDIYHETYDYLLQAPNVFEWNEMQRVLQKAIHSQPAHWQLPLKTCHTVGGTTRQAVPAVAAIACMHIGIILIDDMLDEDPRGKHLEIGMAGTANLSAAFIALGMEAVSRSQASAEAKARALDDLAQMVRTTAWGQHLDSQNPVNETGYWQLVQAKSSPFFGSSMYIGAVLGGAPEETARKIREFGRLYGEMVQIHDDLTDVLAVPANPDWTMGRFPLPLLYAHLVQHPERERFLELRKAVNDPEALQEAQSILIRSGAISYAVHQLVERYKAGVQLLREMPGIEIEIMNDILEGIIAPVWHLLKSVGGNDISEMLEEVAISG